MMLLSTLMLVLVTLGFTSSREIQPNKFENVDVDRILENERIVQRYFVCFINGRPCTADGNYLREALPNALKTNCKDCTPKTRSDVKKVSRHFRDKRPADWVSLLKKIDPNNEHTQTFERFLNE